MPWWDSVVRISRGGAWGSGVFIGEDLILTAGHVVQPMSFPPPVPAEISVFVPALDEGRVAVRSIVIHPRWRSDNFLLADMALLSVEPLDGLGLGVWRSFGASTSSSEVGLFGYPAEADGLYQHGFVRLADSEIHPGYGVISSDRLNIPAGVSGSPFVLEYSDGNVYVVGVATWDNRKDHVDAFNGLPLLPSTFEPLLDAIG